MLVVSMVGPGYGAVSVFKDGADVVLVLVLVLVFALVLVCCGAVGAAGAAVCSYAAEGAGA